MDVSIIIVNYNTCQMTMDCINSIFLYTKGLDFEIILVDNASSDGSRACFDNDDRIKYIFIEENLGFGKANNIGLMYASGKYIFLLNSDTVLLNNGVKKFFDFAEKSDPNIACIGCLLKDKDMRVGHSYGRFPTFGSSIHEWIFYPILHKIGIKYKLKKYDYMVDNSSCFGVDYVTGAALFLKKEIVERYGLFDPDYFMYYEETDMQLRYRRFGFQSVVIDTPEIVHLSEGSSERGKLISKKILSLRSMLLFFRKNRSLIGFVFFKMAFLVMYLPFVVVSPYDLDDKIKYIKLIFRCVKEGEVK